MIKRSSVVFSFARLLASSLSRCPILLALLTSLLITAPTSAAVKTWDNGGGDNNWSTATNWNPDGVPQAGDDVFFDAAFSDTDCNVDNLGDAATVSSATLASVTISTSYTKTVTFQTGAVSASGTTPNQVHEIFVSTFVVRNSTVVFNGNTSINASANATCTAGGGSTTCGGGFKITGSSLTILTAGRFSANGKGFGGNAGPGAGTDFHIGGTHGSVGGSNTSATYGSFTNPTSLGSGSILLAGGGAILLNFSGTVTIDGFLTANAESAGGNAGPAGGTINITAGTLRGTGYITAVGGTGTSSYGGGSGGRISLNGVTTNSFTGNLDAGGNGGAPSGKSGTIYLDAGSRSDLTIGGAGHIEDIQLGSDGTNNYTFGVVTINSGGWWGIDGNPNMNSGNGGAATVTIDTLTVNSGGNVSAEAGGFGSTKGPGGGTADGWGGNYGGQGGNNTNSTYGSLTDPRFLGSGSYGLNGGGALIFVINYSATIDGSVYADGEGDGSYAGGAGGSVNITAGTISGSGSINAPGAGGTSSYGGGGGGRVAVKLTSGNSFGSLTSNVTGGWSGAAYGAAGTLYIEKASDGAGRGQLYITNGGNSAPGATIVSSSCTGTTVGAITLYGAGKLRIDAGQTLSALSAGVTGLNMSGSDTTFIDSGTFKLAGDWTQDGAVVFTANPGSTVTFISASSQTVNAMGKTFATVVSSNTSANGIVMLSSMSVTNLINNVGSTFNANGFRINNTALNNSGNLVLVGTETIVTAPINLTGSTVTYSAGVSNALVYSTWTYRNLIVNGSGGTFKPSGTSITMEENFTLSNGTLNMNSSSATVGGNWTNSATFTAGTSTVTFTGSAPALTGSTTFYNFAYTVAGGTMTFAAASTQTVTGLLTIQGASGSGNLLSVKSSNPGQWWFLKASTNSVSYVRPQDSNASGGNWIDDRTGGVDGGNNVHWLIGSAANYTWSGGGVTNDWSEGANWLGGSAPGAGNTAYFNDYSVKNSTINANVSITSITVSSAYTGTITALSTTTLTFSGAFQQTGGTINLQGSQVTVTGNWASLGGTFSAGTSTMTFNGTQSLTGSTTFYNLRFNGFGGTHTLGTATTLTISNLLTLTHSGAGVSINGGTLEARGDVIQNGGITGGTTALLIDGAGTQTLSGGNATFGVFPAITINKPAGSILYLAGDFYTDHNWTNLSGDVIAVTGSTMTFGTPGTTLTGSTTFYNLGFGGYIANHTITSGSTMTVIGLLKTAGWGGNVSTVNGGAINALGDIFTNEGAAGGTTQLLITGSGTQTFYGSPTSNPGYSPSITVNKPAGSILNLYGHLYTDRNWTNLSGDVNALTGSTVTFASAVSNSSTLTGSTTFYNLVFSGYITHHTIAAVSTMTATGLLTLEGAGQVSTVSGGALNAQGNVRLIGLFNGGSASLLFTGSTDQTYTNASALANTTGNWIINKPTGTVTLASNLNLSGAGQKLTIQSGALDLSGKNLTVNSTLTNGGDLRFKGTELVTPLPTMQSGSTVTYNNTSGTTPILSTWTYRNLVINGSGGTFNPKAALSTAESLVVNAGTLDTTGTNWALNVSSSVRVDSGAIFNLNAATLTIAQNWTNNGTFSAVEPSTVVFTGAAPTLAGAATFYNLAYTVPGGTVTFVAGSTTASQGIMTLVGTNESKIYVKSSSDGTWWYLNATTNTVSYVKAKDSNASGGRTIDASDGTSFNAGHNVNWNFPYVVRYWIAPSSGNWSDSWNWAATSGGTGGASVPMYGEEAIFDGNGQGRAMIDTTISISTLTISTSTSGGYTGYLDTSSNTITISGQFTVNNGQFYARTSSITIHGDLSLGVGTFNAGASSVTFAGTSAQNVYSSSQSYFAMIVANTAGVNFQDSLTVSTFTMTTANALAKLQVSPSSMTVTGYLNLNGQAIGTRARLESTTSGTPAVIFLVSGLTQNVLKTSIKDSSAAVSGVTGNASDSTNLDNTGNFNWTFPQVRYWVAPSSGNWSDAWNWSTTSGGAGGASVPTSNWQAVFDGNGVGRCMIDAAVSVSTLTVSTNTSGSYSGYIDTSSNTITLSSFTLYSGTFYARTSSITIAGAGWVQANGNFVWGGSTVAFTGPAPSLSGSTTFYNFIYQVAGGTLTLPSGSTQTIAGLLRLTGGSGGLLLLRSSNSGTYTMLRSTGTQSVSFVNVKDNYATGYTIVAGTMSVNAGHNLNWSFAFYTPIEVNGLNNGLSNGAVSWGDYNGDGNWDLLVNGITTGSAYVLWVFENNGNNTFTKRDVGSLTGSAALSGWSGWGDYNNDGRLDIGIVGDNPGSGVNNDLWVFRYNGGTSWTKINVSGAGGSVADAMAWGDYNNDGLQDIAVIGENQLWIWRNNGNETSTKVDIAGSGNSLASGVALAWGDANNDGLLDLATSGVGGASSKPQIWLHVNLGNSSFTKVNVATLDAGLYQGGLAWGDYNGDGLLDLVASGQDTGGTNTQLWVYRNDGGNTFTKIDVAGSNGGLDKGSVAWGDFDNDGSLDIGLCGYDSTHVNKQVWAFRYAGSDTWTKIDIAGGLTGGLWQGALAWGDVDRDKVLDLAVSGLDVSSQPQLRVYRGAYAALGSTNTAPSAPATLSSAFTFSSTSVSSATFKWNPAADSGGGATAVDSLTYDLVVATAADFSRTMISALSSATPLMGNYLRPPKIFDGNSNHGVLYLSTQPWVRTSTFTLQTDSTYYYKVRTIDAGLLSSEWTSVSTLYTGVAPNAVTNLSAVATGTGTIRLTWSAPGNDQNKGTLNTGTFRLFYSSSSSDMTGLTISSPTTSSLNKVDIATSSVNNGDAETYLLASLLDGTSYYVRLFTADQVPNWSEISNGATTQTTLAETGVRYWVKAPGIGNWSDTANWSLYSGGTGGASVPSGSLPVVFDGNGAGDCLIDQAVSISTLTISTSTSGGYTGYLDTSSNTITISGQFAVNNGQFYARTSSITIHGDLSLGVGTFNAGASSVTFAGSSAQNVYSSSQTYFAMIVANTAGVTFQDSLTVSTFTMTTPNALAKLQVAPSSMTVRTYLNLDGQAIGTRVLLQSAVPGTPAPILLRSGLTQNVLNTSIQDSSATITGGTTGNATNSSNLDNGNNFNWNFPTARYWVVPSSGDWSNTANWSQTSGGAGGASVPGVGQQAIFDGNGPGSCLIDTAVSISTLTISTAPGVGWNGYIDTSSYTITLSSFTQNYGTFHARTSSITINGGVTITSGTYNANGSTLAVSGSLTLNRARFSGGTAWITVGSNVSIGANSEFGVFSGGSSYLTTGGNWTVGGNEVFGAPGTLRMTGASKSLNTGGRALINLIIASGASTTLSACDSSNVLSVDGTFSLTGCGMSINTSVVLNGTINGGNTLSLNSGVTLSTGGTLSAPVLFYLWSAIQIPARVYGAAVTLQVTSGNQTATLMGDATFTNGLTLTEDVGTNLTLSGTVHDPNITISAGNLNTGTPGRSTVNMGSGTWTLAAHLNGAGSKISQSSGGLLRFNGSANQNATVSSGTFHQIEVTNTAGVTFRESLTVSTFTMTTANALAKLPVSPSSMTVLSYLNLNGQATGTRAQLQSFTSGTPALLRLVSGVTQNVLNTSIKDSSATLTGVSGNATDSSNLDNTGNFNWLFSGPRYWIAPSSGNWSNSWNWATTSGGTGGASVPSGDMHAVFDGNGLGLCMIDTAVSISTLTLSPTAGSGYTNYLDTSSNTITVSSFTQRFGTFYARTSSVTITNGLWVSSGVFNAGGSTVAVTGSLSVSSGTINGSTAWITVSEDVYLSTDAAMGVYNAGSSVITASRNWDSTYVRFIRGTSRIVLNGNGTFKCGPQQQFQSLWMAYPSKTTSFKTDSTSVMPLFWGTVALNGGTMNYTSSSNNSGIQLLNATEPIRFVAPTTVSIVFVYFDGELGGEMMVPGGNYGSADLAFGAHAESTFTVTGALTTSDQITINNHSSSTELTFNMNSQALTASNITLGGGDWTDNSFGPVAMKAYGSVVTLSSGVMTVDDPGQTSLYTLNMGTSNWSVGGQWILKAGGMSVSVVPAQSTVTFNGTVAQAVNTFGQSFGTVIASNTASGGIAFLSSFTAVNFTATGLPAASTIYFNANSTYTITNLTLQGSSGKLIAVRSSTPGTYSYLNNTTNSISYVDVKDNNASQGATINANDGTSVNSGHNVNWNFGGTTRYWVKGSGAGSWSDSDNWALTSGGLGGAGAPIASQQAIFDGNGIGNANIDTAVSISTLTISTSTSGGFSGYIDTSSNTITFSSFTMNNGTFHARTSSITVNNSVNIASGVFNANGSTSTISGNWSVTGGLCDGGVSVINVSGTFTLAVPGYFIAPTSLLTVNGAFSSAAGTFAATQTGTVHFPGGSTLSANGQNLGDVIIGP